MEAAKSRATAAKVREIEAHRRAIKMHQEAVILFDRLHETGKSANAHHREQHAREMLRQALREQEEETAQR